MNKWNNKFRYQVASCWLFILRCTSKYVVHIVTVTDYRTVRVRVTVINV